jgi:predicted sugar kinase
MGNPEKPPQITQREVLEKWGLIPFPVGEIYSPLPESTFNKEVGERVSRVRVSVPGRLNCLIKDPVALVRREPTGEFNYGEISFGINLMTYAEARTTRGDGIVIAEKTSRPSLVRHFAEIVRRSIDYDGGIYIEANNDFPYSHIGTGSSAALATATALAVNKLAGEPIKIDALPLFLARNYGEEIVDDPNLLVPVQCTGGTSLMALHGGLIAVENSKIVQRMEIPDGLSYVLAIPSFPRPDAKGAMAREIDAVFQHILESARHMQPFFAQRFQEIRNAMASGDIEAVGKTIEEVDSDEVIMQGYENMFPGIGEQYKTVKDSLQEYQPICTFISSAGPSFITLCGSEVLEGIINTHHQIGFQEVIVSRPVNQGFRYEK